MATQAQLVGMNTMNHPTVAYPVAPTTTTPTSTTPPTQDSSVNPDEIVHLTDDKTGAVLPIKRSQLASYGHPIDYMPVADINADYIIKNDISPDNVGSVVKVAQDVPGTIAALKQRGYTAESIAQKKDQAVADKGYNTAKSGIQNVLNSYLNVPGYEKGMVGALSANLPPTASANYNRQAKVFAAAVTTALNESKRFPSDQEIKVITAGFPGLNYGDKSNQENIIAMDRQLRGKFDGRGIDEDLLAKYGITRDKDGNYQQSPIGQPKQTNNPLYNAVTSNPVSNLLLNGGGQANVAQDVGAGVNAGQVLPKLDQLGKQAATLETKATSTQDPAQRKQLLQQANDIRTAISKQAGDISNNFSPDVTQNPIARGVNAGVGITSTAELPSIVSGVKNIGTKIAGGLPPITTSGSIAARKAAAAIAEPLDTSSLIKAGDKYAENINPAAAKAWNTLKPAIASSTSASDLLEKLTDWGSKAYTQSGDVRAIAEGQLKNHLYKEGRNIIADQAPDIAKYTTDISKGIGFQKALKTGGKIAGGAAVTGLTLEMLNKMMGH